MRKPKRHVIAIRGPNGAIEVHPMKAWLREHPEEVPPDLDMRPTGGVTSHQIRAALKKMGWSIRETDDEVTLIRPDAADDPRSEAVLGVSDADEEGPHEAEESFEFALESHLRDFIEQNIGSIPVGPKRLRIFIDGKPRKGVEYPTSVGPIDILATNDSGDFVIFELKLARGPDKALGQLLRYMGWVKKNMAGERRVYGVIVAKSIDEKLRYAALLVPDVSLLEYEVDFRLKPAAI